MTKDLKKRGFRFVGSTICYAFMQATGMVNDHLSSCYRHRQLAGGIIRGPKPYPTYPTTEERGMEDSRRDLKDDHLNSLLPDVQVDRRGFVAACIAAGFAVTAEPLLAQAIKTSMDGLDGGDVKVGDIPAYYAVPKGKGKRPVVMVVPEIWGIHEHIKDMVRRVAKAGYFAVANEPYFRIGDLTKLADIKEVSRARTSLPTSRRSRTSTRWWPGPASTRARTSRSSASPASAAAGAWCGCTPRTTRRSMPASPGTAR